MIRSVLVLGGGSAGLMAALALKKKLPQLDVHIVRSQDIGVIGVGESTTSQFPPFLFEYLGISRKQFYSLVRPTWKMGIHFLWGPRESFQFPFEVQFDGQWNDLSRSNGFYCDVDYDSVNLHCALMSQGKAFPSQPNGGGPVIGPFTAFHLFNPYLVKGLETIALERGIKITDAKVSAVTTGEKGVESVTLDDGRQLKADFYVDASGFRSELLSKALGTPFISYDSSLFCDRAIVGSWNRTDDYLHPYTVAETMDCGWAWKIDHEHAINRGYVYSSKFISDDAAREEFQRKNPKAKISDFIFKYRSGRYEKGWVKNVFAIGNACGFVEPLESTALMIACSQIQTMVTILLQSQCDPQPTMLGIYNKLFAEMWDNIRDFLAVHYRFNTRIKNKFWDACTNDTDISSAKPMLDFYAENGPTGLGRHLLQTPLGGNTQFGIEGWLVMLIGQRVPYRNMGNVSEQERAIFRRHCQNFRDQARQGYTPAEALKFVHHPDWAWYGDPN